MTISDRPAVRRRIVEVLTEAAGLETAQVSYAYPGQATTNEAIWLGEITGTQDTVDFGSPRPGRDDNFEISLVVATAGHATEQDADTRCQDLLSAACESLFTAPRLGADFPALSIHPGRLDGPNGFRTNPASPAASVAELTLSLRWPMRGANP